MYRFQKSHLHSPGIVLLFKIQLNMIPRQECKHVLQFVLIELHYIQAWSLFKKQQTPFLECSQLFDCHLCDHYKLRSLRKNVSKWTSASVVLHYWSLILVSWWCLFPFLTNTFFAIVNLEMMQEVQHICSRLERFGFISLC